MFVCGYFTFKEKSDITCGTGNSIELLVLTVDSLDASSSDPFDVSWNEVNLRKGFMLEFPRCN